MNTYEKVFLSIFLGVVFLAFALSGAHASEVEGDLGPGTVRTSNSEGTHRNPFSVNVGSMAAAPQPYDLSTSSSVRASRSTYILNSSNLVLMIGTFSAFGFNDNWIPIPSSAPYSDSVHENYWLRLVPGASSVTIRGEHSTSNE